MITLEIEETELQPGDQIKARAAWQMSSVPESIEFHLLWHTKGKGTEDIEIVETTNIQVHDRAGYHEVQFQLPNQPYSFSGKLISLIWGLEMIVDDEFLRKEFTLSPTGREVVIA